MFNILHVIVLVHTLSVQYCSEGTINYCTVLYSTAILTCTDVPTLHVYTVHVHKIYTFTEH